MTIVTWNIVRACRGPDVGYGSGFGFSEENMEQLEAGKPEPFAGS